MKLRGNNTYAKIINHNYNVLFCYRIKGHFHKLNLDKKFYIGGVPHIEKGLVVFDNFTGCIENMYLNHSSVSAGYLYPLKYDFQNILYDTIGNEVTKGKKHVLKNYEQIAAFGDTGSNITSVMPFYRIFVTKQKI